MTAILHISDPHFGTVDRRVYDAFFRILPSLQIDLCVISGDITQHARVYEYQQARDFVSAIPVPSLVIPGNHDIPDTPFKRAFMPYHRYRAMMNMPPLASLDTAMDVNDVCVVGINSARPFLPDWNWANGRISKSQMTRAAGFFAQSPATYRVLALHHPPVLPISSHFRCRVWGVGYLKSFLKLGAVDIVLCGHTHQPYALDIGPWVGAEKSIMLLNAGSVFSNRRRGQPNSFFKIIFHAGAWKIEQFFYHEEINEFIPQD